MRRANQLDVPPEADMRCRDGLPFPGGVLHPDEVDQERHAVDHGVHEEGRRSDRLEKLWRDDEPDAEPGQCRALEPGGGLPAQELVARRREGDEAQDRWDAGGRGGALEQARHPEDRKLCRQPGHHDRYPAEDRAVEHDPVVPEPIRQDPEDRRQDQLGQVEGGREEPDDRGVHDRAAVVWQVGQVEAQHRPGQAGAEPQGEGAGEYRDQRTSHRGILAARRVGSGCCRAGPGPYHARNVQAGCQEGQSLTRVAIFTDSASDLEPADAAAAGIGIVPLLVNFGKETFKAGVDLSTAEFWERMVAPDAPFPTTAASSPGEFKEAYEAAFASGADAIVSIHVAGTLSATIKSAQIARDMLPDREIHVVDSLGASMAQGILAQMGVELAAEGRSAAEIAEVLEARAPDMVMYVALETLEYLRKGGRISGAQAAIGTLLSVKPIIVVKHGVVETGDRVRTRSKARERLIEMVAERPVERLAILHTVSPDVEAFRAELVARVPGSPPAKDVQIALVGPSVGPHLGPGCVGAVALYRA